jgi:hypothetical protein
METFTPEELSAFLLVLTGVILQLLFKYAPKLSEWYDKQENKGLIMLVTVSLVGLSYFGLSCSPWGALFGVLIVCDLPSFFLLLRAIFIIAIGQQLTYSYTRKPIL